jgi:hypothetical protein
MNEGRDQPALFVSTEKASASSSALMENGLFM